MDKQKQKMNPSQREHVPHLQVRSGLSARADLQNCLQHLAYWSKQSNHMCAGK